MAKEPKKAAPDSDSPAVEEGSNLPPTAAESERDLLRTERDDLLDRLRRTQADFVNYQDRSRRERQQGEKYAAESVLRDILGALDGFDRALETAEKGAASGGLDGVRIAHREMARVLERHGLTRVSVAPGDAFDPALHEAVVQTPAVEPVKPGAVAAVLRAGWRLHDRLLRPAQVAVAQSPGER